MRKKSWSPRPRAKWQWRDYLTPEERMVLEKAEAAKKTWLALNQARSAITNRAIQRAKYDAKREAAQ